MARHGQVHGGQVGMPQRGLRRADHRVERGPDGDEAGPAVGRRAGEVREQRRVRPQLGEQRIRQRAGNQLGEPGAAVRGGQGDQHAHPPVAAQALDVVPRHQPAEGMRDDLHPAVVAGGRRHRGRQQPGAVLDGRGAQRQLHRHHSAQPAPAQVVAQPGEHRAVVDEAVDEQHRGSRRVRSADQQAALQRREPAEGVGVVAVGPSPQRGRRVQRQMRRDARGLHGEAAGARGRCPQTRGDRPPAPGGCRR